jgi:ArsR family transcriptional regulator
LTATDSDAELCCAPVDSGAACCSAPDGGASLQISEVDADKLATIFKALGNPVRLQIVELLSLCCGQVCVCDIEGQFELSQPTISHHLKVLRQAEVVEYEHRGLWVHYFLRADTLDLLRGLLNTVYARAERA